MAIIALTALIPLASCSDNDSPVSPSAPDPEEEAATITFDFPDINFGGGISTRADDLRDPIETMEGNLQSLYLVIYKYDDSDKIYKIDYCRDIKNTATINSTLNSDYDKYYAYRIGVGQYKFYLLANLEEYWSLENQYRYSGYNGETDYVTASDGKQDRASYDDPTDSEFVRFIKGVGVNGTDRNIRKMVLNFSGIITNGHLPMVCMPENLRGDANGTYSNSSLKDGIITITTSDIKNKANIKIYAPLKFLCSKVRLTVLFDKTSFSSLFPEPDIEYTLESFVEEIEDEVTGETRKVTHYLTTNTKGIRVDNIRGQTLMAWDKLKGGVFDSDPDVDEREYEEVDGADPTPKGPVVNFDIEPTYNSNLFTTISKTLYPLSSDTDQAKYFDITHVTGDNPSPDYLSYISSSETWENPHQRAWQSSAIYLPENLWTQNGGTELAPGVEGNNHTTLHVVPMGTKVPVTGYYIQLDELKRDYFYDIVAKMKSTEEFAIGVCIKVNAWKFHDVSAAF